MDTQADAEHLRGSLLPETAFFTPALTDRLSTSNQRHLPVQLGVYRLLAKLGHGGMGTVYKAWHCRLKRAAALKVPPLDCVLEGPALARFHREMELIGRLDHPNIVRATDAGEADGVPYLVMELVDGLDLSRLGQLLGPLPAADACAIAYQVLLGLEYLRENGLVHRDIKPSNVMLTPDGEVKILDLGLGRCGDANRGEELTATGLTMGTADYMAPEQRTDAHRVDIRADIYSLGCTLHKLLTGTVPMAAGEPAADAAGWPVELAAVLRRMLAADKAGRYATPAEAAEALRPFCDGADLAALFARVGSADSTPRATHRPLGGSNKSTKLKPPTSSPKGGTTSSSPSTLFASARRKRIVGAAAAALLLALAAGPFFLGVYPWQDAAGNDKDAAELSPPHEAATVEDPDRRAAKWVLASGGTVDVLLQGWEKPDSIRQPVPKDPFKIVNISLWRSNKVDDDGLKNLQGLSQLRELSLHGAVRVSDKGLAHLSSLSSLQVLDLCQTKITDAGLEWVGRQRQLQRLSVHETAITDAGINYLANLKDLTALNLYKTRVSDRGLEHLTGLTKLSWLQLQNTAVTDKGLRLLRRLPALRWLYLDTANISKEAAADLQAALPKCEINP